MRKVWRHYEVAVFNLAYSGIVASRSIRVAGDEGKRWYQLLSRT